MVASADIIPSFVFRSLVEAPKLEEEKQGQKVKSEFIQSTEESGKFRR